MLTNHTSLLLILLLVALTAIVFYYGMRVIDGFRRLGAFASASNLSEQLWQKIDAVREKIRDLKAEFDSHFGRSEVWENTVGAHIRNASAAIMKFDPGQALRSYQYAEEQARECVKQLPSSELS
jgi:exonuclease VII small subunit